jgi:hypothetical protein
MRRTDNTGTILDSTLNGVPINGTLDASLNVSFNDAQFPGEVLQVTFYTGMVFPLDNWEPDRTFMAGMFQETEVIVRGGSGGCHLGHARGDRWFRSPVGAGNHRPRAVVRDLEIPGHVTHAADLCADAHW